jgi:hypothetical protein
MWTYTTHFKIALVPEGIDIYGWGPGIGEFKDDDIIDKYLCKENDAPAAINHLYEIYKKYPNGDDICDIKYIEDGRFECIIKEEQECNIWDIQDILYPIYLLSDYKIIIEEKIYKIDLEVENVNLIKLLS